MKQIFKKKQATAKRVDDAVKSKKTHLNFGLSKSRNDCDGS